MKTPSKEVEERVKAELSPILGEDEYREMLDEVYSFDSVGGPFAHMSPARVLEEVDPVAYRCGFNDWQDAESRDRGVVEIGGEYYAADEVEEIEEEEAAKGAAE